MKKKNKLLLLSGLVVANTLLGSSGNEDVFATEEGFDTTESQQAVEVATTTEEGLKTQVIPNEEAFAENNGFKIKKTIKETDKFIYVTNCYTIRDFEVFYYAIDSYPENSILVFEDIRIEYKDEIEKNYDLSRCKITYCLIAESFDEYLKHTGSGFENLRFTSVKIQSESISEEEFKKQLYAYTHDKRVKEIDFGYHHYEDEDDRKGMISVPIEYASCIKVYMVPLINLKSTEDILFLPTQRLSCIENISCDTFFYRDFRYNYIGKGVSCKNFVFKDIVDIYSNKMILKINNLETIWIALDPEEIDEFREDGCYLYCNKDDKEFLKQLVDRNISLRFFNKDIVDDLVSKYIKHIKNKDIAYLSGYVNVKNKPNDLSDEEWEQVLILKQKVKEIINAVQTNSIKMQLFQ